MSTKAVGGRVSVLQKELHDMMEMVSILNLPFLPGDLGACFTIGCHHAMQLVCLHSGDTWPGGGRVCTLFGVEVLSAMVS